MSRVTYMSAALQCAAEAAMWSGAMKSILFYGGDDNRVYKHRSAFGHLESHLGGKGIGRPRFVFVGYGEVYHVVLLAFGHGPFAGNHGEVAPVNWQSLQPIVA